MTIRGPVQDFAPTKINLTLHVTGRRPDGYHLLDSLVVFGDVGDRLTVAMAERMSLSVTGPRGEGVPADARNLVWKAAEFAGVPARITLEKHLPAAAGIGGGSSDAAATLRALSRLTGAPVPDRTETLGADIPVCLTPTVSRMQGVGEVVTPLPALPPLHGVLVNPGVDVPTPQVFARLASRENPAMPATLPDWPDAATLALWLRSTRNDLEGPALQIAPVIGDALRTLQADSACLIARMSGSGATCFALTDSRAGAEAMAARIARLDWWVQPTTFA